MHRLVIILFASSSLVHFGLFSARSKENAVTAAPALNFTELHVVTFLVRVDSADSVLVVH